MIFILFVSEKSDLLFITVGHIGMYFYCFGFQHNSWSQVTTIMFIFSGELAPNSVTLGFCVYAITPDERVS